MSLAHDRIERDRETARSYYRRTRDARLAYRRDYWERHADEIKLRRLAKAEASERGVSLAVVLVEWGACL